MLFEVSKERARMAWAGDVSLNEKLRNFPFAYQTIHRTMNEFSEFEEPSICIIRYSYEGFFPQNTNSTYICFWVWECQPFIPTLRNNIPSNMWVFLYSTYYLLPFLVLAFKCLESLSHLHVSNVFVILSWEPENANIC